MLRVVVDTNVWIGSLLKGQVAQKIIKEIASRHLQVFISEELLAETILTSRKSKLAKLINPDDRDLLIAFINEFTNFIKPREKINVCRDKDDNLVLECAHAARTDCIITWDPDLLVLHPFRNIDIITPGAFLKRLKK